MRVFAAVDLSPEAKKEISQLLKNMAKKHWPVKWENPQKLHQTLAFLGSLTKDQVAKLEKACQKAAATVLPFKIYFKGLGAFPNYDSVRIIWLGLKGDLKSLALLQKNLKLEIKKEFAADRKTAEYLNFLLNKPFSPHITLGRVRQAKVRQRREIGRQLKKLKNLNMQSQTLVKQIVVYQSIFIDKIIVYKPLVAMFLKKE
jgi:RNA 2',3'-cyclic 3'-phosphodiesterase